MESGSDKNQLSYDDDMGDGNCTHCGSEGSLSYGVKDLDIDRDGLETVPVEGLICGVCNEIYMTLDESARFLNLKAKHDGSDIYYGVHDGDIKESRLQ